MADIDNLQIQIVAQTTKASTSINSLCRKIDRLSSSLSTLDGHGLRSLASGVSQLGTAMQTMNNVNTTEFTRLAKDLTSLNNIKTARLGNISTNIAKIGQSLSGLSGISQGTQQLTEFANGIKQLGYKSADKAITNIPRLANAMKQLMVKLSKAPKVSKNLIEMTNALAKLARTGASSGKAANSLSTAFNKVGNSSKNTVSGIKRINSGLTGLLKKLTLFVGVAKLFSLGKQSIEIASDLTEVQNVVDATFGDYKQKIEDLSAVSIPELGMSELTTKQIGSRFQAMGTAMGFSTEKMSDMSVELTRLTGDMASFYNVSQEDVGKALQSIFTGETEPMRRYGVDLTNATIQQWALNNGLNANINSMSQAEKAMLRYQYTMERTSVAQGDFARTSGTWANQVRILSENLKVLGSTIGTALINIFKPLVTWLNNVMTHVISAVKTIADALGSIFGWTVEISGAGVSDSMGDIADSVEGIGSAADGANKKLEDLKKTTLGVDEIHALTDNTSSSSSGSSGGAGSSGTQGALGSTLKQTEGLVEKYKSSIKSLSELGEYIGDALSTSLESIRWNDIYKKAENFGKGLADFLNGLISPRLFYNLGRTIANSLNTALEFLNSFGETFDWRDFGESIAAGINGFFKNFNFKSLGKTLSTWAIGIIETLTTAIEETDWKDIGEQIGTFFEEIPWGEIITDLSGLVIAIGNALIDGLSGWFKKDPLSATFVTGLGLMKLTGAKDKISTLLGNKLSEVPVKTGLLLTVTGIAAQSEATGSNINSILGPILTGLGAALVSGKWQVAIPVTLILTGFNVGLSIGNLLGGTNYSWGEMISDYFSDIDFWGDLFTYAYKDLCDWQAKMWNKFVGFMNGTVIPGVNSILTIIGLDGIKPLKEIDSKVEETEKKTSKSNENVKNSYKNMGAGVSKELEDVGNDLTNANSKATNHGSIIGRTMREVVNNYSSMRGGVSNSLLGVNNSLNDTGGKIGSFSGTVSNNMQNSKTQVGLFSSGTRGSLLAAGTNFTSLGSKVLDVTNKVRSFTGYTGKNYNIKVSGSGFDAVKSSIKGIVDKLVDLFSYNNKKFNILTEVKNMGVQTLLSLAPKKYATGGFPEDGFFYANHGELVGKFSNGKTAVANNEQITEGIKRAVMEGMSQVAMTQGGRSNSTPMVETTIKVDSETLYRTVQRGKAKHEQRYQSVTV